MTTLVYNGIVMRDCTTEDFSHSVELDSSGTDVLFSKFRIRVSSTLTAAREIGIPFGVQSVAGLTAVQRATDINSRLWEPRKDFWFLVDDGVQDEQTGANPQDGVLLIATGNPNGSMPNHPLSATLYADIARSTVLDTNNGPKPINVKIDQIFGGRAMRVSFEIEVSRKLCSGQPDFPPSGFGPVGSDNRVLSNRWSLSESKDENWLTTRSFAGTLRVSHHSHWPHLMRYLVIPPLLRGYRRVRQSFSDDPTGLVLKYEVEDQQAEAAPPWPAVQWRAHHAETTTQNGAVLGGEISVRLTGPPGVDKVQLIASAGKVATDRITGLATLWQGGARDGFQVQLNSASIVNVLNEPTIEFKAQVTYVGYTKDTPGFLQKNARSLSVRINEMGRPLTTLTGTDPYEIEGYDPKVWPVPLPFDSPSPAGTFACYLQNPCSVWHGFPQGLDPGYISPPARPAVRPAGYPDQSEITNYPDPLPEDQTYLREYTPSDAKNDIYTFPYTFVELSQTYETKTGWSQLPMADTDANQKTALLVKLHGRVTGRILVMEASRDGRMPSVPQVVEDGIDPNGGREVLASVRYQLKAPELLADGAGRRYAVRTEFTYLLERGIRDIDKMRGATSQLDKLQPSANWLDLTAHQISGLQ
jgi:hypothetical protein